MPAWLPASEEPMFRAALIAQWSHRFARWWELIGVSPQQSEEIKRVVVDVLADGPLTRQEIAARALPHLGEWAVETLTSSWGGGYKRLCMDGVLLFGPSRGNNVTFALRDSWDTLGPIDQSGDALTEVIRRYLRSFGPATLQDAAYWTGGAVRELKSAWQALEPEL